MRPGSNVWTDDEKELLAELAAAGRTKHELCHALPRHSYSSISTMSHDLGLHIKRVKGRRYEPEEESRLRVLLAAGKTYHEIAEDLDRDPEALRQKLVRDHLIPKSDRGGGRRKKSGSRRTCLRCDRLFLSEGIYNRICPACRDMNEARGAWADPCYSASLETASTNIKRAAR